MFARLVDWAEVSGLILTICQGGRETAMAEPCGGLSSVGIRIEAMDNLEKRGVGGALGESSRMVDLLRASENAFWSDARAVWNFLSLKGFTRTQVNKTRDFYSVMAIWSLWNPTLRNYRSDSGSYGVLFCPCKELRKYVEGLSFNLY